MKNITKQYQDLLEGKMSKANFMVNVRRDFPQWISPVNSFDDAINILKSKRILSETSAGGFHKGAPMSGPSGIRIGGESRRTEAVADPEGYDGGESELFGTKSITSPTLILHSLMDQGKSATEAAIETIKRFPDVHIDTILDSINDYEGVKKQRADWNLKNPHYADLPFNESADTNDEEWTEERLLDAMAKMLQINQDAEIPGDEWENIVNKIKGLKGSQGSLNEAATKPEGAYKNVTGKAEYDKFAEMDRVDYRQLMKGTEFELLKMPEITDENLVKAKTKAYKALIKNPKAYMHLVTTNANEVDKKDKDLRMQPVKGDNRVDKANAMKVIKKDEGSNTQTNLSNKEKAKGNPKGVKEMPDKGVIGTEKVLRESLIQQLRENILDEMIEVGTKQTTHNKGEVVKKKGSDKVGTVLEVSSDNTCLVEWEDGMREDIQGNVLEKHTGTQMDEYEVGDETPDSTLPAYSREKKAQDLATKQATEEYNGIKRKDLVKVDAPGFEKNKTYKVTDFTVINPGKIMRSVDVTVIDDSGAESIVNINSVKKVGEDKNAALKEKLVKGLKKEITRITYKGANQYVKDNEANAVKTQIQNAGGSVGDVKVQKL